jgi:hypothetical protein
MVDFFVRSWGNLASVIGLVFSFLAFVFSKRASTAAREARDSLSRAQGQLRSMHQLLSAGGGLSPEGKVGLATSCQEVSKIFSGERGVAARAAEAGDDQW